MKKRLMLLLATVMTITLTACGGNDAADNGGDQDNIATENQEQGSDMDQQTQTAPETENGAGGNEIAEGDTLGQVLLADFKARLQENPEADPQEIADALINSEAILFMGGTMAVEPGLLTGFGNTEITGFKEGVMFGPQIGTIPFVGYIFVVEEDADVDGFVKILKSNADPGWNICTEAEETVTGTVGNTVFFLMCPKA